MFAEIADYWKIALIIAVIAALNELSGWLRAKAIAKKVETVATTLEKTDAKVDKKLDDIHLLTNSKNDKLEEKVVELTRLLTESLQREARRDGAEQERKSPS